MADINQVILEMLTIITAGYAHQPHLAMIKRQQPRKPSQKRGFAAAIGAGDHHGLPRGYGQRYIFKNNRHAAADAEVVGG